MCYNPNMKAKPLAEGTETKFSEEYDVIPPQAVASVQILMKMWEQLGRPKTPFTKSGAKLMSIIISVWEDGYPADVIKWTADRKEYKKSELSISTQVKKGTGRSLASYPLPIYNMMKNLFIGFDPAERKNCIKMVKKWPMFQFANRV